MRRTRSRGRAWGNKGELERDQSRYGEAHLATNLGLEGTAGQPHGGYTAWSHHLTTLTFSTFLPPLAPAPLLIPLRSVSSCHSQVFQGKNQRFDWQTESWSLSLKWSWSRATLGEGHSGVFKVNETRPLSMSLCSHHSGELKWSQPFTWKSWFSFCSFLSLKS